MSVVAIIEEHLKIGAYRASWGRYTLELCQIGANQGLTAEIDWNYAL